jgi:hypothetical protein
MLPLAASGLRSGLHSAGGLGRICRLAVRFFCAFVLTACASLGPKPAASQENAAGNQAPVRNADIIDFIGTCAARGGEAVLLAAANPICTSYGAGTKELDRRSPEMPLQVNALRACNDPADRRVLDARAIKTVAADATKKIQPSGIRVVGAIFCDALDLVGLNLPYMLMLDGSIFVKGIEARNFRTAGDFSFEGALVFGQLAVMRAQIGGTVFSRHSLIQNAQFLDTDIHGALLLREAVLLDPAVFDTVTVTGELSLRYSAFSYFLLQFSKIGSVLDLTGSQARCAYQLRKDEIGDLVAVDSGFGVSSLSLAEGSAKNSKLKYLFAAGELNTDIPHSISQRSVKDALGDTSCNIRQIAAPNVLAVSDTIVKERLCLQAFNWPASHTQDNLPDAHLTLNDVTVDASAFIDLTQSEENASGAKSGTRRFEMLGFRTRSLIYNFDRVSQSPPHTRSYLNELQLYLNGLQFDQVYATGTEAVRDRGVKAKAADVTSITCGYDPDNDSVEEKMIVDNVDNLKSPLPAPGVDDVMSLLKANVTDSTQPFTAFVDVFQKNGDDNIAKQLRIAKADAELRSSRDRIINPHTEDDPNISSGPTSGFAAIWDSVLGSMTLITDLVRLFFGYVLWLLADSGYRPEKVGWFVGLVIVLSFVYFWFWVRIIAIKPEKKPLPLPIGLTFLFDRLLPAYQIRQDHYNIEAFLKRVKKNHPHGEDFRYMMMTFRVAKADAKTVQRVERVLDIIKFLGLVLAVFLVAALNSLVSR